MDLFENKLSENTLQLLSDVLQQGNVKLVIENNHKWVIENSRRSENRFSFNPLLDNDKLFSCLTCVKERGWI